ncbi:progranulin-like [Clavelina lepadiformis]
MPCQATISMILIAVICYASSGQGVAKNIVRKDSDFCYEGTLCNTLTYLERCCPLKQATCCENGLHCCPSEYKCSKFLGICIKESVNEEFFRVQEKTRARCTMCPDGSECPDYYSCCQQPSGYYRCCPYDQGVCCQDHVHCCPHNTYCDVKAGMCRTKQFGIPMAFMKTAPLSDTSDNSTVKKIHVAGDEKDASSHNVNIDRIF